MVLSVALSVSIRGETLSILPRLPDTLFSSREIHWQAFLLSRTARRPAYDMFYLALARREGAALKKEALREGIRTA